MGNNKTRFYFACFLSCDKFFCSEIFLYFKKVKSFKMVRSKRTKLREVEESPSEENTEPEFESKDEDEIEEPVAKKAKSDSDEEPEEEETEENIATPEESEDSKSEAGGNEEIKDTEMSVDDSKPDDSNDSQGPEEETKPKGKKERSPDLAKFWKAVEDDPQDFTGWTYLYVGHRSADLSHLSERVLFSASK